MFFNAVMTSVIAFSIWKLARRLFIPTRSLASKGVAKISLEKPNNTWKNINEVNLEKNRKQPDKFSKSEKLLDEAIRAALDEAKYSKVKAFRRGDIPTPLQLSKIKRQFWDRPIKTRQNKSWKSHNFREYVSDLIVLKKDENVDHKVELQLVAKAADEANIASGSTEALVIKKIFNSKFNLEAMNKELNRIKGKAFNKGVPTIGHIRAVEKGIEDLRKNPEVKKLIKSNPELNIFFKKLEGQVAKANARRALVTKQRPKQSPNLRHKCLIQKPTKFLKQSPKQAPLWHFGYLKRYLKTKFSVRK